MIETIKVGIFLLLFCISFSFAPLSSVLFVAGLLLSQLRHKSRVQLPSGFQSPVLAAFAFNCRLGHFCVDCVASQLGQLGWLGWPAKWPKPTGQAADQHIQNIWQHFGNTSTTLDRSMCRHVQNKIMQKKKRKKQ